MDGSYVADWRQWLGRSIDGFAQGIRCSVSTAGRKMRSSYAVLPIPLKEPH